MTPRATWLRAVGAVVGGVLTAACVQSAPTDFHRLAPLGPEPPTAATADMRMVGLEPVTVPASLDRGEIVLANSPNDVETAATDAWLGPLDAMITNVVAEDLAGHLGVVQVFVLPTRRFVDLDRVVEADVVELVARAEGDVRLAAVWRIFDGRERLLVSGRTAVTESFNPGLTLEPAIAAINRVVARLAIDLATAVENT